MAAVVPFTLEPVWVSPEFRRTLLDDSGRLKDQACPLAGDLKKTRIAQAEMITQLSMDLIDKDSVMHQSSFSKIEERLKQEFRG